MSEQILVQILGELKELKTGQEVFASKQQEFSNNLDILASKQDELASKQDQLSSGHRDLVSGQKELNQIVSAIRTNLDTTNAKLDALTMDVRRVEGHTHRIEQKLDEQSASLRGDLRFLNHRVADLEMDVEKLKTR